MNPIVAILIVGGVIFVVNQAAAAVTMGALSPPLNPMIIRDDSQGSGYFGAPRGSRTHQGLDLVCAKGQPVHSPIDGTLNRYASPYADDLRWKGCEITGTGRDLGYTIKLFYMDPQALVGTAVNRGEQLGNCQAISEKYTPAMTNHLHVEVRRGGQLMDPAPLFFGNQPLA